MKRLTMPIETFSKQEFESKLDYLEPQSLGIIQGEEAYLIKLDGQVSIMVRSSVKEDGYSADTGQDSIRAWLVSGDKPLGSKVSKWTTRLPEWSERLNGVLLQLTEWRLLAGDCKTCNEPLGIFKVKKAGENKGRVFANCRDHKGFRWLDEVKDNGWFSDISKGKGNPNVAHTRSDGLPTETTDLLQSIIEAKPDNSHRDDNLELSSVRAMCFEYVGQQPNTEQKAVIEESPTNNIRVLAPPGAGKTFLLAHRYKFLVANGVKPNSIVAVTFNKTMASELLERIKALSPEIEGTQAEKQICTIHAFCYRVLQNKGQSKIVPKNWELKKILENIIPELWPIEQRPGYEEVWGWIDLSKFKGLAEYSEFYEDTLGMYHGERLTEARSKFDSVMGYKKFTTFADMLYEVERKLITETGFRVGLQQQFEQVLVDEAQDVSGQALRILITISQNIGWNEVYKEWK